MKLVLKRIAIATFTVACVALLSFSWSEHRGVSLGVESAEARVDRPSTPAQGSRGCASTVPAVFIREWIAGGCSRRHHLASELR